jgi:hypothetical protein
MLYSVVSDDAIVLAVWVKLLMSANFERRQLLTGDWLEPGQLILGQTKFAKDLGITRSQLRRCVNNLEKCQNLTKASTTRGTVITITNWGKYQVFDDQSTNGQPTNRPKTDQRPTKDQPQNNNNKNDKNGKKRKKEVSNAAHSQVKNFFDRFWFACKRKVKKENARRAFAAALDRVRRDRDLTQADAAAFIIERMTTWAASAEGSDPVMSKTHPASWLNASRFDDDEKCWSDVTNPFALGSEAHRAREEEDKKMKHAADRKAREAAGDARRARLGNRFDF